MFSTLFKTDIFFTKHIPTTKEDSVDVSLMFLLIIKKRQSQ